MDEQLKAAIRTANRKENERRAAEWEAWVARQLDVIRGHEAQIKIYQESIAKVRTGMMATPRPSQVDENDGITD